METKLPSCLRRLGLDISSQKSAEELYLQAPTNIQDYCPITHTRLKQGQGETSDPEALQKAWEHNGLPRGSKSLSSAEALHRALIERLRIIRVTSPSCVATTSNFV